MGQKFREGFQHEAAPRHFRVGNPESWGRDDVEPVEQKVEIQHSGEALPIFLRRAAGCPFEAFEMVQERLGPKLRESRGHGVQVGGLVARDAKGGRPEERGDTEARENLAQRLASEPDS